MRLHELSASSWAEMLNERNYVLCSTPSMLFPFEEGFRISSSSSFFYCSCRNNVALGRSLSRLPRVSNAFKQNGAMNVLDAFL